ncbi:MAG: TonB-dependent receptor plug domain-containing protein [Oligoflexales bacterium]|nr:TonB-dependent receptor plug domain-containing protein [Oligoflexales bacterium]
MLRPKKHLVRHLWFAKSLLGDLCLLAYVFPLLLSAGLLQGQSLDPPQLDKVSEKSSETNQVTLRVQEKGTGKSLSKVEVIVDVTQTETSKVESPKPEKQKLLTNPDGEVSVVVPEGEGKVFLSRKGYVNFEIPFSELRPPGFFDIFLLPKLEEDEEVIVVTGKKRSQVSRKLVSIEESRRIAPSGDPVQVVSLLPGVQTSGFLNQLVIRGSGPRDSKYYIDDLEVPFIFHSIGSLSVIPAPLIEEVEFNAGGFGPEYGNATGGVIKVKTKTDIPVRPFTEFVLNLPFYSGVFHTRPLDANSSISVSVRRSYVEAFIEKFLKSRQDDKSESLVLVPYFGDVTSTFTQKNEDGYLKVSLIGSYDGLKAALPSDNFTNADGQIRIDFGTSFVNLGLEKFTRLSKDWTYRSTPQFFYLSADAKFVSNELKNKFVSFSAPTEFTKRLGPAEELTLGLNPVHQIALINIDVVDFTGSEDPTFDPEDAPHKVLSTRATGDQIAAWASLEHQAMDNLFVNPGLRLFYNSLIKKTSGDPRLRLRYLISPESTVKAAVGQYSQSPEPGQASVGFGRPDLHYVRSMHYILGVESKWTSSLTSEVQVFYKTIDNRVTPDVDRRFDNEGSAKIRGFELFLRRNLSSRFFGWLSYTYSKNEARDSDRDPFQISPYDQTHLLNLVASYKLSSEWELGTRYNHQTGTTYTPIFSSVYNANLDKYQPRGELADKNSKRLPNQNTMTIYMTKDFLYDRWKMMMKFGMESFWPKPQVTGVNYNYDYSKEQEEKALTNIPFFELRGEF